MGNTLKTIIRHILVVLLFPKKINDFITYAKGIFKAMNGNTNFPDSAAKVAVLKTDIDTLDSTESGLLTNPPTTTVEARNAAMEKVKADLRGLRNDVQVVTDATPAQAEVLAKSAGMNVKQVSVQQKRINDAKSGDVSGSVILTADGGGPHEWQMSKDQVTIINLPATSGAKTTVSNLTPGEIWYFRNRPILTQGVEGDWCGWIKVVVK
jgi:hypothetical protein